MEGLLPITNRYTKSEDKVIAARRKRSERKDRDKQQKSSDEKKGGKLPTRPNSPRLSSPNAHTAHHQRMSSQSIVLRNREKEVRCAQSVMDLTKPKPLLTMTDPVLKSDDALTMEQYKFQMKERQGKISGGFISLKKKWKATMLNLQHELLDTLAPPRILGHGSLAMVQRVSREPYTVYELRNLQRKFSQLVKVHDHGDFPFCKSRRFIFTGCLDEIIRVQLIENVSCGYLLMKLKHEMEMSLEESRKAYESGRAFAMRKALLAENQIHRMDKEIEAVKQEMTQLAHSITEAKSRREEAALRVARAKENLRKQHADLEDLKSQRRQSLKKFFLLHNLPVPKWDMHANVNKKSSIRSSKDITGNRSQSGSKKIRGESGQEKDGGNAAYAQQVATTSAVQVVVVPDPESDKRSKSVQFLD